MATNFSYQQIAENFDLWGEYVDPDATMTRGEFDQMSTAEKVELQKQVFGRDEYAISQGASALGSIRTEKKANAARENGKRGGRPRKG